MVIEEYLLTRYNCERLQQFLLFVSASFHEVDELVMKGKIATFDVRMCVCACTSVRVRSSMSNNCEKATVFMSTKSTIGDILGQ